MSRAPSRFLPLAAAAFVALAFSAGPAAARGPAPARGECFATEPACDARFGPPVSFLEFCARTGWCRPPCASPAECSRPRSAADNARARAAASAELARLRSAVR